MLALAVFDQDVVFVQDDVHQDANQTKTEKNFIKFATCTRRLHCSSSRLHGKK